MFYELEHIGTTEGFKKEQGENFSYPPHLHGSFELILADAGEMTVTVDGREYPLRKGDAALIFPNQVHALRSTSSRHTLFIFSPRTVQAFSTEYAGKIPQSNAFSLPEAVQDALHALSEDDSKYARKGALYTVCALLEKQTEFCRREPDKQDLLLRILSYVERHFQSECSLVTLASEVGYNPEYMCRFFKKKMGIGYNQYLNARRLNHAAHLLTNTDNTCLYCALESGYTSLRSFNRNFKKQFGLPPQEYKNHSARTEKIERKTETT